MTVSVLNKTKSRKIKSSPTGLTAVEFFAGIGLVRLALENQKWKVVFANDIDPNKQEMYSEWFGNDHFNLGDVHKLKPKDVPAATLFTASFPCNNLSIAGAMSGLNGKESSAFFGFMDVVRGLGTAKPPLILLENVVGFLMSHSGKDFETALMELTKLGYSCDAVIINAVHFVPQSRQRLFVIAKQLPKDAERSTTATPGDTRPFPLVEFINSHPNIRWDIRTLPSLPSINHHLEDVIEELPDSDGHWWNHERAEYFINQLSQRHADVARKMIAGRKYTYGTAFRRVRKGRSMAELRTDGVAGCLRTPRGGSGRQILFKAGHGKYKVRLMTARECARLQGVPDSFEVEKFNLNQALFGFGDAVCVPVVEWLVKNYLTPVASELLRGRLLEPTLF